MNQKLRKLKNQAENDQEEAGTEEGTTDTQVL